MDTDSGLVRLAIGDALINGPSIGGALRALSILRQHLVAPPAPQLAINSMILGLEVGSVLMVLARLATPTPHLSTNRTTRTGLALGLSRIPPLVQGVGVLACSWLASLAAGWFGDAGSLRRLAIAFESFSLLSDVDRNPWVPLTVAVGLSLVAVVLRRSPQNEGTCGSSPTAALDAARLAGASRSRASALSTPGQRRRWLGLFVLTCTLAATNLSPALLFTPWTDGRTIAPGILTLANGPGDAPTQAAALALCVVTVNLATLAVARLTRALRAGVA